MAKLTPQQHAAIFQGAYGHLAEKHPEYLVKILTPNKLRKVLAALQAHQHYTNQTTLFNQ